MGVRDLRVVGACSSFGRVIYVSSRSVEICGIAAESRWIQRDLSGSAKALAR